MGARARIRDLTRSDWGGRNGLNKGGGVNTLRNIRAYTVKICLVQYRIEAVEALALALGESHWPGSSGDGAVCAAEGRAVCKDIGHSLASALLILGVLKRVGNRAAARVELIAEDILESGAIARIGRGYGHVNSRIAVTDILSGIGGKNRSAQTLLVSECRT